MKLLESKPVIIAMNSLKYKIRNWQYPVFSLGFPVMFTLLFYFFLGRDSFSLGFPGMVIYATSVGTVSAAISFSSEKASGMMERLDAMPIGRRNIFLGALISETVVMAIQILIMFLLGYVILQVSFKGFFELFIGFIVALLFGISSVGIGIIIAGLAKTVEVANAISLFYYLPVLFLSGSLYPFESFIVYFTPPFWAKQVYLQITVLGHGLFDNLYSSSFIYPGGSAEMIPIPLWGGIIILFGFTISFVILGIFIFQKKTKF